MQPNPHLTGSWDLSKNAPDSTVAWLYRSPIDLSNDGHVRSVMVWSGYGLSQAGGNVCGRNMSDSIRYGFRPRQLPFILEADGKTIDEQGTANVFAGSGAPSWLKGDYWLPKDSRFPFRPLGRSIGIFFEYRGVVYLDTFFDLTGDELGERARKPELANVLGVFVRRNGETRKVCELQLYGSDYPTSDVW